MKKAELELSLEKILKKHKLETLVAVRQITGGLVNQTWVCETKNGSYVVQKLGDTTPTNNVEQYKKLVEHLQSYDIQIPRIILNENQLFRDLSGNVYRIFEHVAHDDDVSLNSSSAKSAGMLLGRTHLGLAQFKTLVANTIPGYHCASFYSDKLQKYKHTTACDAQRMRAIDYLCDYLCDSSDFASISIQTIHGDPKLQNILFRNNNAITLIDWDTLMQGSLFFDIGDALRSWCRTTENTYDTQIEKHALLGYMKGNPTLKTTITQIRKAVSGQIIESASRYMIDVFEQNYFSYPMGISYKEENLKRALRGIEYHRSFLNEIKKTEKTE